ncbi:RNA-directed DNA polymerase [Salimicrobium flavidum]|uniref:RNA-directed DNA polymerase n=1 Tax=Salimicrobium flavidum TaxID=570947 RepID=A0A1N7IZ73_9BACI|nr:RNA-directed DNA polymerase [Salimicrobium flavidum]
MQKSQPTPDGGYLQENRMESERNVEACSISCGETDGKDGVFYVIDKIASRTNLNRAYEKVKANKGAAGVDGMNVQELYAYLVLNKRTLISEIKDGSYEPSPVRRAEIDKEDGSKRKLGIPTVKDRLVQQAILQVLERTIDPTFSDNSFGFRPNRNAHDAIRRAKEYYEEGHRTVVDIDMEQYFDTVNHDKLMYHIGEHVEDPVVLRLIRKFLRSGVSVDGAVYPTEIGCPQGGGSLPSTE